GAAEALFTLLHGAVPSPDRVPAAQGEVRPSAGTTSLALVHYLVYSRGCEVGQRARGQDAVLEAPGAGGEGPPGAHLAGREAGRPPRAALGAAARTCVRRRSWHVRRAGGLRRADTRRRAG